MKLTIRKFLPRDLPKLERFLRDSQFGEQSRFFTKLGMTFSEDVFKIANEAMLTHPATNIGFVADLDEEIVGHITGVVVNNPFNFAEKTARMTSWGVVEKHRSHPDRIAEKLLIKFEMECIKMGIMFVITSTCSATAGDLEPLYDKLYKMYGYNDLERLYIKKIKEN